jgi:hypothetical protein
MCLVVWHDASFSLDSHWADGTQPRKPKAREHVCITAGWLTHLDTEFVQITQTITQGQHANVANIPRGMVRSIQVLEVAGELEM